MFQGKMCNKSSHPHRGWMRSKSSFPWKNPLTLSTKCAIIGVGEKSGGVPLGQQRCHGASHSTAENLRKKHLTFSTKCGRINMKGEGHTTNQKGLLL